GDHAEHDDLPVEAVFRLVVLGQVAADRLDRDPGSVRSDTEIHGAHAALTEPAAQRDVTGHMRITRLERLHRHPTSLLLQPNENTGKRPLLGFPRQIRAHRRRQAAHAILAGPSGCGTRSRTIRERIRPRSVRQDRGTYRGGTKGAGSAWIPGS